MRHGLWIGVGCAVIATLAMRFSLAERRDRWQVDVAHRESLAPESVCPAVGACAGELAPLQMLPEPPLPRAGDSVGNAGDFVWDQQPSSYDVAQAPVQRRNPVSPMPVEVPLPQDPDLPAFTLPFDHAVEDDIETFRLSGPLSLVPIPDRSRVDAPVDAMAVDPAPLRRQLVGQFERKLQLMTVEQMCEALENELSEIRELEAAIELEQARRLLESLTRSHPETDAAKAARDMLQTGCPADAVTPTSADLPLFQPIPSRKRL